MLMARLGAERGSVRFFARNEDGEPALLVPILVVGGLVLLTALGAGTAYVVSSSAARTAGGGGPLKTYAALPDMSFTLGGGQGRHLDLHVLLEVEAGEDARLVEPYAPRIADRLADRLRDVEPAQLAGAAGAQFMKGAITSAIGRELKQVRVREVLLDRMIVR